MAQDVLEIWKTHFPQLIHPDDQELQELVASAKVVSLQAGQTVFESGASCDNYLLLISGELRVQLLGGRTYPAEAITESEVTALVLQARDFNRALQQSERFRQFVFENFGLRKPRLIGPGAGYNHHTRPRGTAGSCDKSYTRPSR